MSIDKEKNEHKIDASNLNGFKFHSLELKKNEKTKKCSLCGNFFDTLPKWIEKIVKKIKPFELNTFLIGTTLSFELVTKEDALWERVGIEYCEPLKSEINREIGKALEKRIGIKFNSKNPDANIILDLEKNKVIVNINPLFIYAEYQKLKRGIPQTRLLGRYKTSVAQIIAKPFLKSTKGKDYKFHGGGREDINAKCLGWRPFVLEIIEPEKRRIDLKTIARRIGKAVNVRNIRFSDINEVRRVKEARTEKTYRAVVRCNKKIQKKQLKKLKLLITEIKQRTPERVKHSRAKRLRKRKVKNITFKFINSKRFEMTVRGEAGLYIKELVSGDNGRTRPSVSDILGVPCICKQLDVIKIHLKKKH